MPCSHLPRDFGRIVDDDLVALLRGLTQGHADETRPAAPDTARHASAR